jgi:hypothetical protein
MLLGEQPEGHVGGKGGIGHQHLFGPARGTKSRSCWRSKMLGWVLLIDQLQPDRCPIAAPLAF